MFHVHIWKLTEMEELQLGEMNCIRKTIFIIGETVSNDLVDSRYSDSEFSLFPYFVTVWQFLRNELNDIVRLLCLRVCRDPCLKKWSCFKNFVSVSVYVVVYTIYHPMPLYFWLGRWCDQQKIYYTIPFVCLVSV